MAFILQLTWPLCLKIVLTKPDFSILVGCFGANMLKLEVTECTSSRRKQDIRNGRLTLKSIEREKKLIVKFMHYKLFKKKSMSTLVSGRPMSLVLLMKTTIWRVYH